MKSSIAAAVIGCLAAAQSRAGDWKLPADVIAEESAYQIAHVIDQQQTLSLKSSCRYGAWHWKPLLDEYERHFTCRIEEDGWYGSGNFIGEHPSDRSIYAYMSGEAAAHLAATMMLNRFAHGWVVRAWEGGTIAFQIGVVAHNAHMGLTVRF